MPALSKEFLDIQATIECEFTLKCVRDMITTVKKGITIINAFKNIFKTVQKENQTKYGLIKAVNFITVLLKMVKRQWHKNVFNIQWKNTVAAERFIGTLKNKIYKHIAVSKNVYFDVLNDIFDKYNNTYHQTIKMKPIHVKSCSFAMLILVKKILNFKMVIM